MTEKKLIEIPYEMIDQIMEDELKDSLERSMVLDCDENGNYSEPDYELIKSLKVVLRHFMVYSEYEPYMRELALTEMAMFSQLMGLYEQDVKTTEERPGT